MSDTRRKAPPAAIASALEAVLEVPADGRRIMRPDAPPAPAYYVERQRGARHGWVGPIGSERQARREAAAWSAAGWAAIVHEDCAAVRQRVRQWEEAVERARYGLPPLELEER